MWYECINTSDSIVCCHACATYHCTFVLNSLLEYFLPLHHMICVKLVQTDPANPRVLLVDTLCRDSPDQVSHEPVQNSPLVCLNTTNQVS